MKKTHVTFLRRIIGDAIDDSNRATLTEKLLRIKTPSSGIYRMMRDIVCDVRFYSVTENDAFWKNYGSYRIGNFIDSLSEEEWEADETLTILKEDFLNDWMLSHMMPMSEERRKEIEAEIRLNMSSDDTAGMPDPEDHDGSSLGILHLGIGIKDATNRTGEPADGLPTIFKDYMDDANGGTSPGLYNDGHRADARFLGNIDPSITTLAEIIGRRGKSMEPVRGKFRPAPKSDINGVTLSNDLNSLLPSELALLASPYSEKIFLNRYVRKRLQTFSSVSSSRNHKEKHGPIYICIDTSGSMTGEPEEIAKILVLAIAISAQKEKRTVCILNYSDSISFFVLRDLKTQR
ncbi:MAG: hypothetical protein K2H22_05485, partial [Muribaculaceae bacterium]|nr:hypothetical protein [Muribaculaceae bacterium]